VRNGACWLTDLGSRSGTHVNGRDIRNQGEWRLFPEDVVLLGETTLRFQVQPESGAGAAGLPPLGTDPAALRIVKSVSTDRASAVLSGIRSNRMDARLALLLELPLQFATTENPDQIFQLIMQRVISLIPAAKRGALVLRKGEGEALLLKAFVAANQPVVSESLARRAMTEGRGFIWQRGAEPDISRTVRDLGIENGMYAPLRYGSQMLGVLCVDSPNPADHFIEDDLRLLIAVAEYAAMAVANQELVMGFQRQTRVLERLLANFSPSLRQVLVNLAQQGRLRPGGVKSEVCVLFADLCGFTAQVAGMDANDTLEMLNDYFPALANAVFQYNGVIDKYIGDAVLAVFGSPQPDPHQHENAVRAAWTMLGTLREINQRRAGRKEPTCDLRIGIHCGEVIHGFIGAADRLEFTVIGNAVNRASRFCQHAKAGEILISHELYQRVFNLLAVEKTTINPKEGELVAYRIQEIRKPEPPAEAG
jgi:adenylate cyclase